MFAAIGSIQKDHAIVVPVGSDAKQELEDVASDLSVVVEELAVGLLSKEEHRLLLLLLLWGEALLWLTVVIR